MPEFFKKNLLSDKAEVSSPEPAQPILDPEHELESPLDTPELEAPYESSQSVQNEQPQEEYSMDSEPEEEEEQDYGYYQDPFKVLVEWEAPARPFRKKDRSFYTTVAILIALISLIALLAGEKILVGALLAFTFLIYVLNFVPPQNIKYKLSTQGVTIENHFYHWQELDSFWFTEKDGSIVLHILTQLRFPAILMVVLSDDLTEEEIRRIVLRYLPYHEIAPKSTLDKWSDSLQKHFPLENPHR